MPIGTSDGKYFEDEIVFEKSLLGQPQSFSKTPNDRVREGHVDVEGGKFKVWEQGDQTVYQNNKGDMLPGYIT